MLMQGFPTHTHTHIYIYIALQLCPVCSPIIRLWNNSISSWYTFSNLQPINFQLHFFFKYRTMILLYLDRDPHASFYNTMICVQLSIVRIIDRDPHASFYNTMICVQLSIVRIIDRDPHASFYNNDMCAVINCTYQRFFFVHVKKGPSKFLPMLGIRDNKNQPKICSEPQKE